MKYLLVQPANQFIHLRQFNYLEGERDSEVIGAIGTSSTSRLPGRKKPDQCRFAIDLSAVKDHNGNYRIIDEHAILYHVRPISVNVESDITIVTGSVSLTEDLSGDREVVEALAKAI